MNLLSSFFFHLFSMVVGLLPFPLLYKFSNFLSFFLRRIIKYRRDVVMENLGNSFPEMEKGEISAIEKMAYLNLSDIILEGIRAFTMSKKQLLARHRILNPEIFEPYLEAGQGVIVVTGHYGNWEWGALSPALQTRFQIIGFYKPLKNKYIDQFVRKNRSRYGTILSPIRETTNTFEAHRGKPVIYLMAADQSPSNREMAYWVNFLGRETAFLHGPEKHARINQLPVFFVAIRRVKRGYYELDLSMLAEDPSIIPDGEITNRYASKMEDLIREYPANWLWSHKRWKLTR